VAIVGTRTGVGSSTVTEGRAVRTADDGCSVLLAVEALVVVLLVSEGWRSCDGDEFDGGGSALEDKEDFWGSIAL